MATTVITVPNGAARRGWTYELESQLAAGNDVEFNDDEGNEIEVPFVQGDTDFAIRSRRKDVTQFGDYFFVKGGWHQHWVAVAYAAKYTTGANVKVRFD